ncbi:MAG: HAD-IC family P-type ATPase, partial [Lutibacter sp.]|nr:HAD-IC family P-type ATPase [Lutibacter sp.]
KQSGDKLFAGGKQTAGAIEMEVINSISQSYLTQLWSSEVFSKDKKGIRHITDAISKYFTLVILCIALLAGIYWYLVTPSMVVNVVTAVLIIACPCALALSAPFAFGNMLRIFGYQKYYLKNAETLESMAGIDTIIFDKTGTITTNEQTRIHYRGAALSSDEQRAIKTVLRASNHPLSRSLYAVIDQPPLSNAPERFEEVLGSGIEALVAGLSLQLGAAAYTKSGSSNPHETAIHIRIDGVYKGAYVFNNSYRAYTKEVFESLADKYDLVILSGDNEGEKAFLEDLLPPKTAFAFHQKPADKLAYIKRLQEQGSRVMMIGDGLNDAGALAQSDVGIAIAENVNVFSPACDAILDASLFEKLPLFMLLSRQTISIIKLSFVLSFLYNLVGMYFALTGQLTPVIAAILMPLSSISIVVFVSMLTNLIARKLSRGQSR